MKPDGCLALREPPSLPWFIFQWRPLFAIFCLQVWLVSYPPPSSAKASSAPRKRDSDVMSSLASRYRPEAALFQSIFPFHLVLNDKLRVVQVKGGMEVFCGTGGV